MARFIVGFLIMSLVFSIGLGLLIFVFDHGIKISPDELLKRGVNQTNQSNNTDSDYDYGNDDGMCEPFVWYTPWFPYPYTGLTPVFVAEIVGVFCTFLGLAIVVDEYFVPSLEIISNLLELSPDVAGATFMAVGSSAPEFFAAFAASLSPTSSTGVGTIVGSVIFNITFIYGAAIFFTERSTVLEIDYRPLIRDSIFFVITILVLFFVLATGNVVFWYEGLAMLFLYGVYIVLVKYSTKIFSMFPRFAPDKSLEEREHGKIKEKNTGELVDDRNHKIISWNPNQLPHVRNLGLMYALNAIDEREVIEGGLTAEDPPVEEEIKIMTSTTEAGQSHRNIERTHSKNSHHSAEHGHTHRDNMINERTRSKSSYYSLKDLKNNNTTDLSESPQDNAEFGDDQTSDIQETNGDSNESNIDRVNESNEHKNADNDENSANDSKEFGDDQTTDIQETNGDSIESNIDRVNESNEHKNADNDENSRGNSDEDQNQNENAETTHTAVHISALNEATAPKQWHKRIIYFIAWPIIKIMHFTIPDCRQQRFKKYYVITFLVSLVYIAILAHFLVGWAEYIGCFLSIPQAVTGLTILAAGSSIPEVVSSIAVAKQGMGDMVIANSMGSNVFDILVCLGFPWVIFAALRGPIAVDPEGLVIYVGIALLTVIVVFSVLLIQQWKLDRPTGVFLFVFYGLFLVFAMLVAYPTASPIINVAAVNFVLPNL